MGVLAVSKVAKFEQAEPEAIRDSAVAGRPHERSVFHREVVKCGCDRRVVLAGVGNRVLGQTEPEFERRPARLIELFDQIRIALRINDDQNVPKVFRRRPHHARAADVDLLDELVKPHTRLRGGFGERIEIHDHHVDWLDPMASDRLQILRMVTAGEDAAVDVGVEGLHAAVHHFGESGDLRHVGDRQPGVGPSVSARAVPPVDTNSKCREARARATSTMAVLFETLSRALGIRGEVQYYL
jgi:hypothetical protein